MIFGVIQVGVQSLIVGELGKMEETHQDDVTQSGKIIYFASPTHLGRWIIHKMRRGDIKDEFENDML